MAATTRRTRSRLSSMARLYSRVCSGDRICPSLGGATGGASDVGGGAVATGVGVLRLGERRGGGFGAGGGAASATPFGTMVRSLRSGREVTGGGSGRCS